MGKGCGTSEMFKEPSAWQRQLHAAHNPGTQQITKAVRLQVANQVAVVST